MFNPQEKIDMEKKIILNHSLETFFLLKHSERYYNDLYECIYIFFSIVLNVCLHCKGAFEYTKGTNKEIS